SLFLASDATHSSGMECVRLAAPQYLPALLNLIAQTCNVIDAKDFTSFISILEYAPSSHHQKKLLQHLISQSNQLTLKVIAWLPNNFAQKRELTAEVV